jgi:hypothetical protein
MASKQTLLSYRSRLKSSRTYSGIKKLLDESIYMAFQFTRKRHFILMSFFAATLLSGCATPSATDVEKSASSEGFQQCQPPRPEMCTREFVPVCGHVDTGIRCVTTPCQSEKHHTYGNACTACADSKVIGYEQGDCASYGK